MRNRVMRTVNNKLIDPMVMNRIQPTSLADEFSRLKRLVAEAENDASPTPYSDPAQDQSIPDATGYSGEPTETEPESDDTDETPDQEDMETSAYNQAIDDAIEKIREDNPHEDDVKSYIAILQSLKKPFGVTGDNEQL